MIVCTAVTYDVRKVPNSLGGIRSERIQSAMLSTVRVSCNAVISTEPASGLPSCALIAAALSRVIAQTCGGSFCSIWEKS